MIILRGEEKLETDVLLSLVGKIQSVIYARVSTTDQAEKGHSLESQIERCKDRAITKFKVKEDEIIALVEAGGMGDDPNRPALNYGLYLLEKGLGKTFIVLHPDRLTRDNTLQGVVSRKIWNLGVDLEFVEFEVDPTNPESMLMYNIQGSIAQYNKAKILANSKRGRTQKAKKGEIPSFKRLYGYTYNKETDKLEINEEEKEIIHFMIDAILNKNTSCNQLAKEMSKRGIAAPSGNVWYQNTITRIFRNEVYTGTYYYGQSQVIQINGKKKQVPKPKEEWIAISIPPIIDQLTFQKLQEKITEFTKGKGRKSKDYLLKGIAKCGRCGGAAGSGITSKVKSGTYKYYACRKKASKGYEVGTGNKSAVCNGKNWRVDLVDEVVWNEVNKLLNNPEKIAQMFVKMSGDENKRNLLFQTKKKIEDNLKSIASEENNYILLFGKGKISEVQFDALTEPLNEQKRILDEDLKIILNQISNLQKSEDETKVVQDYIQRLSKTLKYNLDIDEKKQIVRTLIEKVILHEDDNVEIVWRFGVNDLDNRHKKQNHNQEQGFIFYVNDKVELPEPEWKNGEHIYSWEQYQPMLDKLVKMNHNELKTPFEIQNEIGILVRDIKKLFEVNKVELLKLKEVAAKKREKDFQKIYDLHCVKKLSLKEIYRQYGFSPIYCKRVLKDGGILL